MHIVVIGLGEVGRHLVRILEKERHDIVVIDHLAAAIQACEDGFDVMTILGYGASTALLTRAGAARADLAAATAKEMGAKKAIARVQGAEWTGRGVGVVYNHLNIDVIVNPQVLVADELALIARSHGALDVVELADGLVELAQVEPTDSSRLVNKTLAKLRTSMPDDTLVAAVVRKGELFVPGGGDVLLPRDRVYLLGKAGHVQEAEDLFTRVREAQRVCIGGGSVVGEALARRLRGYGVEVLLIERDHARAEELSERLEGVTVVHGDGADLDLLREEDVGSYDLFTAMYADDQDNLLASLIARKAGATRTAALVQRPGYSEIYRQLGIDIVLSPRVVASEHILRYCRQTTLQALRVLEEGQAEVFEILAPPRCRAVGVPLARLKPPRGVLIGALLRHERIGSDTRRVIIPGGGDMIHAGDTVVVLATRAARGQVPRLFEERAL
jgi:trk system potassium uptake protein TrkA